MKAKFTEKQPPVRWQTLPDGYVDVTICLNEDEIIETYTTTNQAGFNEPENLNTENPEVVTQRMWEYDFHQFREKADNINQENVEKNPEKYLDYEPQKEKTLEEQLQEQAENIRMLTECLLEMSEMVYA